MFTLLLYRDYVSSECFNSEAVGTPQQMEESSYVPELYKEYDLEFQCIWSAEKVTHAAEGSTHPKA